MSSQQARQTRYFQGVIYELAAIFGVCRSSLRCASNVVLQQELVILSLGRPWHRARCTVGANAHWTHEDLTIPS